MLSTRSRTTSANARARRRASAGVPGAWLPRCRGSACDQFCVGIVPNRQQCSSMQDRVLPDDTFLVWPLLATNVPCSHSDKVARGSVPGILHMYQLTARLRRFVLAKIRIHFFLSGTEKKAAKFSNIKGGKYNTHTPAQKFTILRSTIVQVGRGLRLRPAFIFEICVTDRRARYTRTQTNSAVTFD
jgi:hypothetical protein